MNFDQGAVDAAVSIYGEDAREFARLTVTDADRLMDAINQSVEQNNLVQAALDAHALKSIMRQIGVASMGSIAHELEVAGNAERWEEANSAYVKLRAIYIEVRAYLKLLS